MSNVLTRFNSSERPGYPIQWRADETTGELKAFYFEPSLNREVEAAWCPQYGSQLAFLMATPIFEVLYEGTRGPGKGLPLEEPVWTPLGQVPIGKVRVGTVVCCPDGSRSKVIGVFPQGQRPTYELEFDDGAIARCDDQHIWGVHVQGEPTKRKGWDYRLMTMPEVLRQYAAGKRLHIPTLDNLSTQDPPRLKDWPVEPYLLGLLLGDGSLSQGATFCTVDEPLAQYVLKAGAKEWKPDKNGVRNFGFAASSMTVQGITRLKLRGRTSVDKFIPEMYLNASPGVRLAVLQGLMDTDGTTDSDGYVTFSSASRQLSQGVQHLARSLGARATLTCRPVTLNGERKHDAYEVYIQAAGKFEPFRLARKQKRVRGYQHDVLRRRIVRITPLGLQETVCIKIDHPQGLFITRDFVVTHNTDSLIMDFVQHVGKGYGAEWKGILFRQTYPQLSDVITKCNKWIHKLFPGARFNKVDHVWTFPEGETLMLRHMRTPDDYWNYHGHAYPWIAWEELCNWPDSKCYTVMMSCCRSTFPGMPRCYRATTNPYGPGHNWVKSRWRLPYSRGKVITDSMRDGEVEPPRVAIHGSIYENKILLHADPDYIQKIKAAARNPAELAAWIEGSWDIVAGGMFDDIWDSGRHIVPPVPPELIPKRWKIDRSFDWGSSKPFAVLWFAESNGEPFEWRGHTYGKVRGDTYILQEWYGWNGTRNEGLRMLSKDVAKGILDREDDWGIRGRVKKGPADASIFDVEDGHSIAEDMEKEDVRWLPADKSPGSRKHGWEQIRKRLKGALPLLGGGPREEPGLFVMDCCQQTIETLPVLPRDDKNLDDVNTEAEDHIADALRYRVRRLVRTAKQHEA